MRIKYSGDFVWFCYKGFWLFQNRPVFAGQILMIHMMKTLCESFERTSTPAEHNAAICNVFVRDGLGERPDFI